MDIIEIIKTFGLIGIYAIVFAESGLLIGFFLPGDSLLFTAGFLASQGYLPVVWLAVGSFFAAVIGDSVGYTFGKKIGPKLFQREESFLFKRSNLEKAQQFYEKHGKFTIVIARFTPIVRTFAPIVAGISNMNYNEFVKYNIFGGFLWTFSMSFAGFFLGNLIPDVDKYLLPIVAVIVVGSLVPSVLHLIKENKKNNAA